MKTTLNFIMDGADVSRYHTVTTLVRETVGHHSHGVACLALLLDPNASRSLIIAALLHDISEHKTGDIPSPAKRQYNISDQVDLLEQQLMFEAGIGFPKLDPIETRILKLADIAHGAIYCAREMMRGNSTLRPVYDRYMRYAREMSLKGERECELFNLIEEMGRES